MARYKKNRRIGYLSSIKHFAPVHRGVILQNNKEEIILTHEEFETIRLIDYKGYTQVECSKSMNIARTTVQELYSVARHKLSIFLLEGRHVFVKGGTIEYVDDETLEREVGFDDDTLCRRRQRRGRCRQNRFNNQNKF